MWNVFVRKRDKFKDTKQKIRDNDIKKRTLIVNNVPNVKI